MKLAVLGGSFNPPHNGHIYIAKEAVKNFGLDKVLFVVAKDPPHKSIAFGVAANERYRLTEAALFGEEKLEPCNMELAREGKSYTVDTLRELRGAYPNAELYLIVGGDMLQTLKQWRECGEIFRLAQIIAAGRPGSLPREKAARELEKDFGAKVHCLNCGERDISSTAVRERVCAAEGILDMVPPKTAQLIYEKLFYQPKEIALMAAELESRLKSARYRHSLATMGQAVELARIWGENGEKARLAGLLHDCAKLNGKIMAKLAEKYGMVPTEEMLDSPPLLHGPVGAAVAKKDFGVTEQSVLNAICRHTIPAANMTLLDKIIYVADKTEPLRDYDGVEGLRKSAGIDINIAVLECIDGAVAHVLSSGKRVAPATYAARQGILADIYEYMP